MRKHRDEREEDQGKQKLTAASRRRERRGAPTRTKRDAASHPSHDRRVAYIHIISNVYTCIITSKRTTPAQAVREPTTAV